MFTLLYGNDAYRLRHALKEAISTLQGAPERRPIFIAGRNEYASTHLQETCAAQSLFDERQLVVITDIAAITNAKKILADASTADIIAVQNTATLSAAEKRHLHALESIATKTDCYDELQERERPAWIQAFCKTRNRTIEKQAINELLHRVGSDTWHIAQELEKVCAYSEHTIDRASIQALVPNPTTHDEWEFSNAFAAQDKRAILRAWWKRLRGGIAEPLLIGLTAAATRTLLLVKDGVDRALPASDIARMTGLHQFVVSKNIQSARRANRSVLRKAHLQIARLEYEWKRGQRDSGDGLLYLLLDMA